MTVANGAMLKSIITNTVIFFCIPDMKMKQSPISKNTFNKASVREIYSRLMTFYNCCPKKRGHGTCSATRDSPHYNKHKRFF